MRILRFFAVRTIVIFVFLCLATGLGSFVNPSPFAKKSPLSKYISDYQYTPFVVFRKDWGIGTVVTFKKKAEQIVAMNGECLAVVESSTDAVLSSYSYSLSKDNNIELNLSKILSDKLNLKGAFADARVKTVTINLVKPIEKVASEVAIKRKIVELASQSKQDCLDAIFASKNTVIARVLLVESLSYTFYDKNNQQIAIDAQILNKINADVNFKRQFEGKKEIRIDSPTMIGYRLLKFNASGGFQESSIKITTLTPQQIVAIKNTVGA